LRKLGKAEQALARIETILSISDPSKPIQPSLRLQIAKLYLDVDESQKVIDTLSGLAKLWPEDVEIASTLSQAYQRQGDEPMSASYAAIADSGQKQTVLADGMLFELLNNPNRTAEQCYALGHLLLHKKSRENGIYWLEAALKLDEKFAPAHQDLALYYDRTEQPQYAAIHRRYLNAPGKP
jgi:tetratricopeptide (TPR) repeat protein